MTSTAYNLTIDVYGQILGAAGAGGYSIIRNGQDGGAALQIAPSSSNNIVVFVRSSGRIYGGGGGGEYGADGTTGASGTCATDVSYRTGSYGCNNCPKGTYCAPGYTQSGCIAESVCGTWRDRRFYYFMCYRIEYTTVSGGTGGTGGNGANGRGYNNQTNSLAGSAGTKGQDGQGCPNPPYNAGTVTSSQKGTDGENGGNGGDWGAAGGNTSGTGNGGAAGRAIFGSNYSVTGTINSTTIRGSYAAG